MNIDPNEILKQLATGKDGVVNIAFKPFETLIEFSSGNTFNFAFIGRQLRATKLGTNIEVQDSLPTFMVTPVFRINTKAKPIGVMNMQQALEFIGQQAKK